MKHFLTLILFVLTINYSHSSDSLTIQRRIYELERDVKQINANQLNYRIEKDLLRETYSTSYDKINVLLTSVSAIFAIIAFFGLRSITATKKEYEQELSNLRNIKVEWESKLNKISKDLEKIVIENNTQNDRIQFLDLKDKTRNLVKNEEYLLALDYANEALLLNGSDIDMLNIKARIQLRLNRVADAIETLKQAKSTSPNDSATIRNMIEFLYFANRIEEAERLISENNHLFEKDEDKKILEFFRIFGFFHSSESNKLLKYAQICIENDIVNGAEHHNKKKLPTWDITEAEYFMYFQPDNELRHVLTLILAYLGGNISANQLREFLNINLATDTGNEEELS